MGPRLHEILDLDRYPIDRPESAGYRALVAACQDEMAAHGMFNLDGFVRPAAISRAAGGEFEYRSNLRSDTAPNYDGVAQLLAGTDPAIRINPLAAGTFNVFAGKNTLHRVSTVRGERSRLVAVFS